MKRANLLMRWALWLMAGVLPGSASGQGVLVFGAVNPNSPAGVQPNGYAPGQCGTCGRGLHSGAQPVRYRTPDVIYVGAARGYPQPNYFSGWGYGPVWSSYWAPNVIPFGLGQAYVHGYLFRHSR